MKRLPQATQLEMAKASLSLWIPASTFPSPLQSLLEFLWVMPPDKPTRE